MTAKTDIDLNQYVLNFPFLQSNSVEDFVVGACNRIAAGLVHSWPDWPAHALVLAGGKASGKTHLARIWQEKAHAKAIEGPALSKELVPGLGLSVVLEHADEVADWQALLHLFNWLKGEGGFLLMTAREAPAKWNTPLKDIASRLHSIPVASLGAPDEEVLSAAIAKQFSDRQIIVEGPVIE